MNAGRVRFRGEDITGLQLPRTIHKGIVLVPERDKVFTNLTVAENLEVVATSREEGSKWQQIEEEIFVYFPRLAKLRNKPAGLLSGGERQMLAIGGAGRRDRGSSIQPESSGPVPWHGKHRAGRLPGQCAASVRGAGKCLILNSRISNFTSAAWSF